MRPSDQYCYLARAGFQRCHSYVDHFGTSVRSRPRSWLGSWRRRCGKASELPISHGAHLRGQQTTRPPPCAVGTGPTETVPDTDRWSSNPAHTGSRPARRPSPRRHTAGVRSRSASSRNRRRCANRAIRWHRPASNVRCSCGSPCGTACHLPRPGRSRCPAGSRDR